jgi:hypothetical protein
MLMLNRKLAPLMLMLVPFAATACGGDDDSAAGGSEAEAEAVTIENPATITGTVAFEGTAPQGSPIDLSEEPTCAEKHANGAATTEEVVVNSNGTLRNVFVWVKEGLPDRGYPASSEPVTIDQDGCMYRPHVLGVQTGQPLVIKNSDGLLHNINAKPSQNRTFNISQPRDMESTRTFSTQEVMVPVECDVHGWMSAYIGVVDHPYFVVTGEDGSFEIGNLPPGDYVLEAWHETYGTQTMNVTVGPDETGEANFSYSASTAQAAIVPLGAPIDLHDHGDAAHQRLAHAAAGR